MAAIDEARNVARAVRRLGNDAARYAAAAGDVQAFEIGNRLEYMSNVAAAAQANWQAFNAQPLSNGQKRQILAQFFADPTADFAAQLNASRAALTTVEQTYTGLEPSTGDRRWNATTHVFDKPTITKAARTTLDSNLSDLEAALPALLV